MINKKYNKRQLRVMASAMAKAEWWNQMTAKEKKSYMKQHPASKMKKLGMGDGKLVGKKPMSKKPPMVQKPVAKKEAFKNKMQSKAPAKAKTAKTAMTPKVKAALGVAAAGAMMGAGYMALKHFFPGQSEEAHKHIAEAIGKVHGNDFGKMVNSLVNKGVELKDAVKVAATDLARKAHFALTGKLTEGQVAENVAKNEVMNKAMSDALSKQRYDNSLGVKAMQYAAPVLKGAKAVGDTASESLNNISNIDQNLKDVGTAVGQKIKQGTLNTVNDIAALDKNLKDVGAAVGNAAKAKAAESLQNIKNIPENAKGVLNDIGAGVKKSVNEFDTGTTKYVKDNLKNAVAEYNKIMSGK